MDSMAKDFEGPEIDGRRNVQRSPSHGRLTVRVSAAADLVAGGAMLNVSGLQPAQKLNHSFGTYARSAGNAC